MNVLIPPPLYRFWLKIAAITLFFFSVFRGFILFFSRELSQGIPTGVLVKAFVVGLRFDLNVTCLLIAPFLLLSLLLPARWHAHPAIGRVLFGFFLAPVFITFFLSAVDFEFLRAFDQRASGLMLEWRQDAVMSLGMVFESYPIIKYAVVLIILCLIYAFLVWRLFRNKGNASGNTLPGRIVWFIVFSFLILLGVRGRIEKKTTLNLSVASFSNYPYANKLALNSAYTFFRDVFSSKEDYQAFIRLLNPQMSVEEACRIVSERKGAAQAEAPAPARGRNVVLILGESFAARGVKGLGGQSDLAPEFDRLSEKGTLYTRFYANGAHTFAGLFSVLFGLPNPPGGSILKRPEGWQKLGGLAEALKLLGYHSYFFCPHDPHFDNMQGILYNNGFERVYGSPDYATAEASFMGVMDGVLFGEIEKRLPELKKPCFLMIMTGSNHPPFAVPDSFSAENRKLSKPDRAFRYMDHEIIKFIRNMETASGADSILFAVTGDHGTPLFRRYELDPENFRVPLLLYAPGYIQPARINAVSGHLDISPTLCRLLGAGNPESAFGQALPYTPAAGSFAFAPIIEGKLYGGISEKGYLLHKLGLSRQYFATDGAVLPGDSAKLSVIMDAEMRCALERYVRQTVLMGKADGKIKRP